jgi:hypothetical protein
MTASGSGRSPMRNARSPPSTPRYRPPLLDLGAEPPVLLDHLRRRPIVTLAPVGLVGGSSSATPPDARFSCRASCAITGFGSDPRYSRTARSRSTIGYFLVAATENFLPPGTQDQTWLGSLRKSGETHRPRTSRFVGHRAPPNRGKLRATVTSSSTGHVRPARSATVQATARAPISRNSPWEALNTPSAKSRHRPHGVLDTPRRRLRFRPT